MGLDSAFFAVRESPPGPSRHYAATRYSVANGGIADMANLRVHALMPLEAHQRAHRHAELPDLLGAAEIRQIDDEAGRQNIGADLLEELAGRFRGAAGGDEIVDHAHALKHRVLVHFHFVDAVFERIADAHPLERQLALLADRHEAGRDLVRNRAAEDEAARLDAGDLVDLTACPRLHQFVDGAAERPRVAQERRDVAKHDAWLGIIRDGADR